jgi:hypothetical protein
MHIRNIKTLELSNIVFLHFVHRMLGCTYIEMFLFQILLIFATPCKFPWQLTSNKLTRCRWVYFGKYKDGKLIH